MYGLALDRTYILKYVRFRGAKTVISAMASDGEVSCFNDPHFAVIYSFLKVFGKLYGLEVPSIAKLQEYIDNTEEVAEPLKDLHLRLLRRALKSVHSDKWERALIKFCHQQGSHQEAWEVERFTYKNSSVQVKLKVLKNLLEHQFTCHNKFKSAVNAIPCKELRLDPIGKDKNGCAYWLQVDEEANLCLYKEDQDDETWQLVARNREELVKVINNLKNGEEVGISAAAIINEDSSDEKLDLKDSKSDGENEEFLSPESESESSDKETATKTTENIPEATEEVIDNTDKTEQKSRSPIPADSSTISTLSNKDEHEVKDISNDQSSTVEKSSNTSEVDTELTKNDDSKQNIESIKKDPEKNCAVSEGHCIDSFKNETNNANSLEKAGLEKNNAEIKEQSSQSEINELKLNKDPEQSISNKKDETTEHVNEPTDKKETVECSEAIEEPVMVVSGEGEGADCEGCFIIGDEIEEPILYIYGWGEGEQNCTGNADVIEQASNSNDLLEKESKDHTNGMNSSNDTTPVASSIKLRSRKMTNITKRSLKKQSNDTSETNKSDSKKHCTRSSDTSVTPNDSREGSVNTDKNNTDIESPEKINKRKTKAKGQKSNAPARKLRISNEKELTSPIPESDDGAENKSAVVEKRKSSVSAGEQDNVDEEPSEKDPIQLNTEESKSDGTLPPKKIKLETSADEEDPLADAKDDDKAHSSCQKTEEPVETKSEGSNAKEKPTVNDVPSKNNSTPQRKTIKAKRGKFKKAANKAKLSDEEDKQNDQDVSNEVANRGKSLKRTLVDANQSDDKVKSESQSESEGDEPALRGKRLKIKPKKIVKSVRKKVEEKVQSKNTSDESEEETLYSLAEKKSSKKSLKKKGKLTKAKKTEIPKVKNKDNSPSEEEITPVRQSRRIALLKIREEADRRHMEEVALKKFKKKNASKDDEEEEEWKAGSSASSGSAKAARARRRAEWRPSDTTPPHTDSDSDPPLFEHHHEEPDLDFSKSDHEFSPESDLETGEPSEPLKKARTLQEDAEAEGGACVSCGLGSQPEWILLCDGCDAPHHAACLKPVLFLIPSGDWFCPTCNHKMLIEALEKELVKYDELVKVVEEEKAKRLEEEKVRKREEKALKEEERHREKSETSSESSTSEYSSSSEEGAVYRLRQRKQLPVSQRAKEYDRLISYAIKEEYVEPVSTAGNQGRGKDISTIIEAAEEERQRHQEEAIKQGKPIEVRKSKKQRRKPRKLNSLDVPSEDDDETDEDFKETAFESTSEDISSDAEKQSASDGSKSSDDLPIRQACRSSKKERRKLAESSPEVKKKKKGVIHDSTDEEIDTEDWIAKQKARKAKKKKRLRGSRGDRLTQYDAEGRVIRRVTYGGLSPPPGGDDWQPKHRTRQKKINYTEVPNTDSEDEIHKSSGKHMPDSSDEFRIDDSEMSSSGSEKRRKKREQELSDEEKKKALNELITKTVVVPLEKLPEDVTKAKTEELQAHLSAAAAVKPARGRGSRGPRRARGGGRGRGRGRGESEDPMSSLVGIKIKDLSQPPGELTPLQQMFNAEKEKKRQEREAVKAEKEARRAERLQKKEEREKLKEQKAKEREEKRLARLAIQENKRVKKEKPEFQMGAPVGYSDMGLRAPFPPGPRLQVRPELRGMRPDLANVRAPDRSHLQGREGTLSVAGSPQPFKPVSEEPSIITRMPHMLNQQYRGPMMYGGARPGFGFPRGQEPYAQYAHYYRYGLRPEHTPPDRYPHPAGDRFPHPPRTPERFAHPPGPSERFSHPPGMPERFPYPHGASERSPRPPGTPERFPHPPGTPERFPHPPGTPERFPHPPGTPERFPHPPGTPERFPHPPGTPERFPHPPGTPERFPHPPGTPERFAHPPGAPERFPHPAGTIERFPHPPGTPDRFPHPVTAERFPHPSGAHERFPYPSGPQDRFPHPPGSGDRLPHPSERPHPAHRFLPPHAADRMPLPHHAFDRMPHPLHALERMPHPGHPDRMTHPSFEHGRFPHPAHTPDRMAHQPPPHSIEKLTQVQHDRPDQHTTDKNTQPPIQIKTEIKTEPEVAQSEEPAEQSEEASPPKTESRPNHPKIKRTDSKDRKPRYPLGPYAPQQFGPYGPYAPPSSLPSEQRPPIMTFPPGMPGRPDSLMAQRLPAPNVNPFRTEVKSEPESSRSPSQRPPSHPHIGHMEHIAPPNVNLDRPPHAATSDHPPQSSAGNIERTPSGGHVERPSNVAQMERPASNGNQPERSPALSTADNVSRSPHPNTEHTTQPNTPNSERPPHSIASHPERPQQPHVLSMERPPHPNVQHMERPPHPSAPHMKRPPHQVPHMVRSPNPNIPQMEHPPHPNVPHMEHPQHHNVSQMERPSHPNLSHMERAPPPNVTHMERPPHPNIPHMERPPHPSAPHMERPTHPNAPHMERPLRPSAPHMERAPHPNFPYMERPSHPNVPHMERPSHQSGPHMERLPHPNVPHMERVAHPSGPHMERGQHPGLAHPSLYGAGYGHMGQYYAGVRAPYLPPHYPAPLPPPPADVVKEEPPALDASPAPPPSRDEGSVFGGLVSYFSSQREDIDT